MSLFQALPSLRRQGLSSFCNVQSIHITMQKTIKLYETPDMKVFEMHAEGVMCTSDPVEQDYGIAGGAGANGSLITIGNDEDY